MERVRLYDEKGNRGRKEGVGLFTGALMARYPWLPVEEDGRLHDPLLRENFVERVFALHELNALRARGLTRHGLLAFHSRYKLQLLAHHRRATGRSARSSPRCMNGRIWRRSSRFTARS